MFSRIFGKPAAAAPSPAVQKRVGSDPVATLEKLREVRCAAEGAKGRPKTRRASAVGQWGTAVWDATRRVGWPTCGLGGEGAGNDCLGTPVLGCSLAHRLAAETWTTCAPSVGSGSASIPGRSRHDCVLYARQGCPRCTNNSSPVFACSYAALHAAGATHAGESTDGDKEEDSGRIGKGAGVRAAERQKGSSQGECPHSSTQPLSTRRTASLPAFPRRSA